MKRVVARFESGEDAASATRELRGAGLDPDRPVFDNPFFDPTTPAPEARGILVGALVGGILGLGLLLAIELDVLWIPRTSPMMSADQLAVPTLGLGLGMAIGGFLGGVLGTLRPLPESTTFVVAVETPDDRVREVTSTLRDHGATSVAGRVTVHETPRPGG